MANIMAVRTFFPRRISQYCPAMQYASEVNYNGVSRVTFGSPTAANATLLVNAGTPGAGVVLPGANMLLGGVIPDPYGRVLQIVASGANATVAIIDGWDYLGQPMTENLTLNGSTLVVGNKAFKYIRQLTLPAAAGTVNLGSSTRLGLPYKALRVEWETADQVLAAAGTLTAASLVDPQTATTTDPRGSYAPTTTPDGVKVITAAFDFMNDVNAAGNGGLHGLAHFGN